MNVNISQNGKKNIIIDKLTINNDFKSHHSKKPKATIPTPNRKKIFIVHGHDKNSVDELKKYLQNELKYSEPIVLSETACDGKTIIEAFEEAAENTGLVFVFLTPDDLVNDEYMQARPNVLFELGYFMEKLGRESGRVIILLKGDVRIPSDLHGIRYIRIDNGIYQAGEEISKAIMASAADLK